MNREGILQNNLFFTCSLIEYIARKTKNKKSDVVSLLEYKNIQKIYDLAEVYHSENIDKVADEFIEKCNISIGNYDNISNCNYRVPTHFEIGKVYQRLIIMVDNQEKNYIKTTLEVLSSWIIEHIDNYNSSLFYENPNYIYSCYIEGKIL